MPKIKIISAPPGGAPDWVRKEWVGLELPVATLSRLESAIAATENVAPDKLPENEGGYQVRFDEAISILEKKSKKAAEWWRRWRAGARDTFMGILVFKREVCQWIP